MAFRDICQWKTLLVVAIGCALGRPAPSGAQIIIGPGTVKVDTAESEQEVVENVFLPAERAVLQRLARARRLLEEARYGEAVRYLGAVLDGPEDYFFQPDKSAPTHRSLKAEAQRLIGQMPRQGRELYELQYGARAEQMLSVAVAAGDARRLAEVSRRFFHTRAGNEATLLLGLSHLDHGEPLAGALTLQRLQTSPQQADRFEPTLSLALATCWLRAGNREKAAEALVRLKRRRGDVPVWIAGREVPWFDRKQKAVEWLIGRIGSQPTTEPEQTQRWAIFRGGLARNAVSGGGAPLLNLRWRVPAADDPLVEALLDQLREASLEQGIPTLPGLHPLAVDDVVLMRTSKNLLALDFVTGKRLWEVPVDDPLKSALNQGGADPFRKAPQLAAGLAYRMWDDAIYGTMSSDGRHVFTVEDLPLSMGEVRVNQVIIPGRTTKPTGPKPHNRLAAHDIRTGKLKWHLGGPDDQYALREAETFFLGPPLPLMGRLYVLAEKRGEIRLMALDACSGAPIWSQQLAVVERNILQDPLRRLGGVSPSYADGVLVCPTSAGAVVAVELATRSLLWGYCYGRGGGMDPRTAIIAIQTGQYPKQPNGGRWLDATCTIADGRVLVTPIESEWLHCLDLIGGELLWKCRRKDDLYVACVHRHNVVLVGRGRLRAVRLADGEPAWEGRGVDLPEAAMPSGRGFLSGDRYYVPLDSAQVAGIDLVAGRIAHLSRSLRGRLPGNLVCYKDRVISQGMNGLDVYDQLDAVRREVGRRLAENPEDPVALSLQGEILLDEGKREEAVTCLRCAEEAGHDPRTRMLLRDALLEGLEVEFAANRDRAQEIEQLLDDRDQQATFLRLMATGLHRAGEPRAALEHYLKLIDLDGERLGMEAVTQSLSVRRDRWIQARLEALRREAAGDLAAIDAPIEARLNEALQAGKAHAERRFLAYFGNHPAADKARRALLRRLKDSGDLLEAELLLWPEQGSSDPLVAGPAVAELAALLRESKRPADAAACYRRLGERYADVVCKDGKTGKQLLDALSDQDAVSDILQRDDHWPKGKVESREKASRTATSASYGRYALPYRSDPGPFLRETAIRFDQSRRKILGYDGLGHRVWELPLVEEGRPFVVAYNHNVTQGQVCGHLLLLSTSNKIIAVDTLGAGEGGKPKLLWTQDVTDPSRDVAAMRRFPVQLGNIRIAWGAAPFQIVRYYSQVNTLGPVTDHYVCFQRFRKLLAVDPLSGETLWIQNEIPRGSSLFGDEELVFALPPQGAEALVFRALDGHRLGKRRIPRAQADQPSPAPVPQPVGALSFAQSGLATLGRMVLLWREESGQRVLEMFDPWEQRPAWPPRKFSSRAQPCLVEEEEIVAVMEPDGRLLIVGLPDGRVIADRKLDEQKSLSEIILFRLGSQYMLVTHNPRPGGAPNPAPIQPMYGTLYKPISYGHVYAFDMEGKPTWPKPATIRDQHLLLNQPGRLPVLTFACQTYQRQPTNNMRYKVSIQCLDKRMGRTVFQGEIATRSTNTFEIVGDPKNHTVELRMRQNTVTLTFTDQPIPPPSEEQQEPEEEARGSLQPARALFKAIQKAIGTRRLKPEVPDDDPFAEPPAEADDPFAETPAEADE